MLGLVVGGIAWYANRPKPWKTDVFKVTFLEPVFGWNDELRLIGMSLEYKVENTTDEDYSLATMYPLMISRKDSLENRESYKLTENCFIPARQTVKCGIQAPAWFDTSLQLDGFVVFDTAGRFKIVFPKPTHPTEKEREDNDRLGITPSEEGPWKKYESKR